MEHISAYADREDNFQRFGDRGWNLLRTGEFYLF